MDTDTDKTGEYSDGSPRSFDTFGTVFTYDTQTTISIKQPQTAHLESKDMNLASQSKYIQQKMHKFMSWRQEEKISPKEIHDSVQTAISGIHETNMIVQDLKNANQFRKYMLIFQFIIGCLTILNIVLRIVQPQTFYPMYSDIHEIKESIDMLKAFMNMKIYKYTNTLHHIYSMHFCKIHVYNYFNMIS